MLEMEEVKKTIRSFLLENLFDGSNAHELTDSTPLVTSGILDSIFTLQMVAFLEETFHIEYEPNEIDQDHFNTISLIANTVLSKPNIHE